MGVVPSLIVILFPLRLHIDWYQRTLICICSIYYLKRNQSLNDCIWHRTVWVAIETVLLIKVFSWQHITYLHGVYPCRYVSTLLVRWRIIIQHLTDIIHDEWGGGEFPRLFICCLHFVSLIQRLIYGIHHIQPEFPTVNRNGFYNPLPASRM